MTSFLRSSKDAAATDEDDEAIDSMWHHREGIQIFDSTPYKTISGKFFKSRNFGAQFAPVDVASYFSPYSKTPESSREGFQLLHPTRELRRHSIFSQSALAGPTTHIVREKPPPGGTSLQNTTPYQGST
jgi:hypothetical protein